HDIGTFEQVLETRLFIDDGGDFSEDQEIHGAFAQVLSLSGLTGALRNDSKYEARITSAHPFDDGAGETDRKPRGGCGPQLPGGRIGQELDVLYALPQFIEDGVTAIEHGAAVVR